MAQKIEVGTETFVRFWLVIVAFLLGLWFLGMAGTALLIIGMAIFLAIAINPLVKKIDRNGKRRGIASVLAVILVVGIIGGIVATVGPVVATEASKFFSESPVTGRLEGAKTVDAIGRNFGIEGLASEIWKLANDFWQNKILAGLGDTVVAGVGTLASIVTGVIFVMALTIMFLVDGPNLLEKFWKFVSLKNKEAGKTWERIVTKMAEVVTMYVTGQLTVALLDGIMSACIVAALSMVFGLSVGLAVPMGLATMVCYMIPMIGPVIGAIIVGMVLFFSNPVAGVSFVIIYIIYQQIESNVIAPKVQGNKLRLPMSVILASVVIGMYAFGLIGAIISIPVAGCIKVLIEEYSNILDLAKNRKV